MAAGSSAKHSNSTARALPRSMHWAGRGRHRRRRGYVKQQTARTGANSYDTAAAHGTLAVGYARAGRDADAVRVFSSPRLPVLMAAAQENADEDDPTLLAARSARLQRMVETYIGVLRAQPDDVE